MWTFLSWNLTSNALGGRSGLWVTGECPEKDTPDNTGQVEAILHKANYEPRHAGNRDDEEDPLELESEKTDS